VTIDVVDDGTGSSNGDGAAYGHGLIGMRERVALLGGELEAAPRPEGGFAVHARLPISAAR
jgi:signal transduction histidine kinase